MNRILTCMGSGQYNLDIIKVRKYPEGFTPGKRVPYEDVVITTEAGGTISAVFISELGKVGLPRPADMTEDMVRAALDTASCLAASCAMHLGSKGWLESLNQ